MEFDGMRQRQFRTINHSKPKISSRISIMGMSSLFLTTLLTVLTLSWIFYFTRHTNGLNLQERQVRPKNFFKRNSPDANRKKTDETVHILLRMPFLNAADQHIIERYQENFEWLLAFSSVSLHLHLVIPEESFNIIDQILKKANNSVQIPLEITKYQLNAFNAHLEGIVKTEFGQDSQFSKIIANRMPCFVLPFYFPQLNHLIMIESSLVIRADVADLVAYFRHFNREQMIGIALQQIPAYRASFLTYEKYNPGSNLGKPSKPGFNSALLLLDFQKMRHSMKFNAYLHDVTLRQLVHKYFFIKHNENVIIQDDILTLIGYEHSELFYTLPCGWNRQLESYYFSQSESREYNQCDGKIYAEYIEVL